MAVVVPSHGLAVTAAPGTGSTSLRAWALALPGAHAVPDQDVRAPDGSTLVDAKHATVTELRAHGLWSDAADAAAPRVVTTTRDPFEHWHANWYRSRTRWAAELDDPASWVVRVPGVADQVRRAMAQPFDAWLEDELGPLAAAGDTRHLNAGHVAEAHAVLRVEQLGRELCGLVGEVPAPAHDNRTAGRPEARAAYTPRARWLVEQVHAPDLRRFGYRWDRTLLSSTAS